MGLERLIVFRGLAVFSPFVSRFGLRPDHQ